MSHESQDIDKARAAILEELARRFRRKDPGIYPCKDTSRWHHPQPNYFYGRGFMTCPICKAGKLMYERSGFNGHVRAMCETKDCVNWQE